MNTQDMHSALHDVVAIRSYVGHLHNSVHPSNLL